MHHLFKYIGIPHVKGARKGKSLDCWGLVCLFYKEEFNIILPDYSYINTGEQRLENSSGLFQETNCYRNFDIVPYSKQHRDFSNIQYGDIIVFNIGGHPIHTGINIGDRYMLHSHDKCGSTIERFTDNTWINRLRSFHRYVPQKQK